MKKGFYFILIMLFIAFPVKAASIFSYDNYSDICTAIKEKKFNIYVYSNYKGKSYPMESSATACTDSSFYDKNETAIKKGSQPFVYYTLSNLGSKVYIDDTLVKNSGLRNEYSYLYISNRPRSESVNKKQTLNPGEKMFFKIDLDKSIKSNNYKDLRIKMRVGVSDSNIADLKISYLNSVAYYLVTSKKIYGPFKIGEVEYEKIINEVETDNKTSKISIYNMVSENILKNVPSGVDIIGIKVVPYEYYTVRKGYFRLFGISLESGYTSKKSYESVTNAESIIRHNIVNNMLENATIKWEIGGNNQIYFYNRLTSKPAKFPNKKTIYGILYTNQIDTTINAFINQTKANPNKEVDPTKPKSNPYFSYKLATPSNTKVGDKIGNPELNNTLFVYEKAGDKYNSKEPRKSDLANKQIPWLENTNYLHGLDCSSSTFLATGRELPYIVTMAGSANFYKGNNVQIKLLGNLNISIYGVEKYLRDKKTLKSNEPMSETLFNENYDQYIYDKFGTSALYDAYGLLVPGDHVVCWGHVRMETGYPVVVCKDGTKFGGSLSTKYKSGACDKHGGIDPNKSYVITTEVGSSDLYKGYIKTDTGYVRKRKNSKTGEKEVFETYLKYDPKNWKFTLNPALTDLKADTYEQFDHYYDSDRMTTFRVNKKYTFEELNTKNKSVGTNIYLPFRYTSMSTVSNGKVEKPNVRLVLDKAYTSKETNQKLFDYIYSNGKLKGTIISNYMIDAIRIKTNDNRVYYIYPTQTNAFSLYSDITDKTILQSVINNKASTNFTISVKTGPNISSVRESVNADKDGYITIFSTKGLTPKKIVKTTGISLDKTTVQIGVNKSITIKATLTPSNAEDQNVNWTTSDPSVATVSNGKITGVGVGTAVIAARTNDTQQKATIKVTVVQPVTGISLSKSSTKIEVKKTEKIEATIAPSDATNKKITWTSSDTSIATVTDDGLVKGIKVGTATITATTKDGNKKATCKVTIFVPTVAITGISLDSKTLTIKEGETGKLVATVSPSNATDKKITWISSDTSIATVANGVVTGKKAGNVTITAKSSNGKTATAEVTVKSSYVAVKEISLNLTGKTINANESFALTATISPSTATNKTITWTSSDATIASVANGVVTGKKAGTATITAKSNNGKTAITKVTVKVPVTKVALSPTSKEIEVGSTVTLTATISPSGATDKTVTWTSSDTTIASVANGVVTGKKAGTATITAKSSNGKTANAAITVKTPVVAVTSVKVNIFEKTINTDETFALTATISPSTATNKTITWTSSDATVASVKNGVVTGKKAGTATITAKTPNGKMSKCVVTVKKTTPPSVPVTGLTLSPTSKSVLVGSTVTLIAAVSPNNATDKKVTWTSSDTTIATVVNGVVTGKKGGTVTITASSNNGKTATATVTVREVATSVVLSSTNEEIEVGSNVTLTATIIPKDAVHKVIYWSSSDESVATIENGVVTGKKAGTATITAKTGNGKKATATIKVKAKVIAATGITLSPTSKSINVGTNVTLTATISPNNATDKKIIWTSSDATIASVSNGVVIGKKGGKVTITASSNNGKTATAEITVNVSATGVTLSSTTEEIDVGASATLVAVVTPNDATNKGVTWTSSDATIASVSNGVVTGKKVGTVTITAKTSNGKTATATIKVKTPVVAVTGVTLSPTSKEIEVGKTATLVATVNPSNAADKEIIWTSSDISVATVDENGKVTGKKAGTATITAKSSNGNKQATSTITVKEVEVTEVSADVTNIELETGETDTVEVTISPSNATNKTVTWTSSNESVATIDTNGKITAKKAGAVTITAKSSNGKTATFNVKVVKTPAPEPEEESTEIPPEDTEVSPEPTSSTEPEPIEPINPSVSEEQDGLAGLDDSIESISPTKSDDSSELEKETNKEGKDNTLLIVGLSAIGVLGVGAGVYVIGKRKKEEPVQENTNYQDNNYQNYSQDNMNNQNGNGQNITDLNNQNNMDYQNNQNTDNNIDNSNNQNN